MNALPKIPPSSVRPGFPPPLRAAGTRSPEPRIYFTGAGVHTAARSITPISLFPHESEDARLTGETRSLFRRLLALNLPVVYESHTVVENRIEKIA
ncbi:hypothetical protein [Edaphobacter sp. 12200R-103]|jgi:hypothetical protein|uniref:hypothetical protein n=1 Tax=Edaphobacter sp. 12200R-103 TaxID=2703788 RepID=UPI00138B85C0|nr:hypothetical protein [Edaphobacter sp. 12200R-103]QHS53301.1 hypothetical protein GWR55_17450 [Edaphobacter sp. 12200R-103]